MTGINYPNDPQIGDEFRADGVTWRWDGVAWSIVLGGTFTNLSDTPQSYSGQAGNVPCVKSDETGLFFIDIAAANGTFSKTFESAKFISQQPSDKVFLLEGLPVRADSSMTGAAGTATYSATADVGVEGVAPALFASPEHYKKNLSPGTTDMSDAWNSALRFSASRELPFKSWGDHRVSKTIGALQTSQMSFDKVTIFFDLSTPENYEFIKHNPSGPTNTNSDKRVCWDTRGMTQSDYAGSLTLVALGAPSSMTLADRENFAADFVAFSASDKGDTSQGHGGGAGGFSTINRLRIVGFWADWWRGNFNGPAGDAILPYTGLTVQSYQAERCLHVGEFGTSANGLDTTTFQQYRVTRCTGNWRIVNTEFNAMQFFSIGLRAELDAEPGTVALTAGSTTATLSEDNTLLGEGSYLCCVEGGTNPEGGTMGFVSRITAKSGTTLTLERAPDEDATASVYMADPPNFEITRSLFKVGEFYPEHYFRNPMEVGVEGEFEGTTVVSGGDGASLYDAPIAVTGREGVRANTSMASRQPRMTYVKSLVACGLMRGPAGTNYSSGRIEVSMPNNKADNDYSGIRVVSLDSEDITQGQGYDFDGVNDLSPNLILVENYPDVTEYKVASEGSRVAYSERQVPMQRHIIADINGYIGGTLGKFNNVTISSGTPKTAEITANDSTVYVEITLTPNTRYCATFTITGVTGPLRTTLYQDATERDSTYPAGRSYIDQVRNDGTYTVFFTTPNDTCNRVTIESPAGFGGLATITQFDVFQVYEA